MQVCHRSSGFFGIGASSSCYDQAYNVQVLQDTGQLQKAKSQVKGTFDGVQQARRVSWILVPANAGLRSSGPACAILGSISVESIVPNGGRCESFTRRMGNDIVEPLYCKEDKTNKGFADVEALRVGTVGFACDPYPSVGGSSTRSGQG